MHTHTATAEIEQQSIHKDELQPHDKPGDAAENEVLEALGYANPYRQALKTLGTWCIVISLTSPLSAIYISAFYQINYGGYWGLTWGWFIPSLVFLPQALSVAALCSSMPVNGAFYWWTAALAPRSCAKFLSFISGWTCTFNLATSVASFSYAVTSSTVLGITYLAPEWIPTNPQLMAIAFGIVFLWAGISFLRLEEIGWIYLGTASIIVLHLVVFLIALPTTHALQHLPFTTGSQYPSPSSPPAGSTNAWSTPAYVAEATHDARRSAPRAILTSYCTTAIFGLLICIIFAFCITDMDAAAADPTGFGLLTLLYNHWGAGPTAAFILVVTISVLIGGSAVVLAYSFQIAAFARDGGLPMSEQFAKVNARINMPARAQMLLCGCGCVLLLFSLSTVARNIIYSLAVMAYLMTYALPNILVVFAGDRWQPGPFNYGRFDKPVFAWAALTQIYLGVMEAFPAAPEWMAETFNYNWVVASTVVLSAAGLYFVIGKNHRVSTEIIDGASCSSRADHVQGGDEVTKVNSTAKSDRG